MTPDSILMDAEMAMEKALDYLKNELRGLRTGRASTALVEYIKVDYYGSPTDLKSLASISVPEPSQILIKPFDAGAMNEIRKAIETSDLGLNPMADGKQIRINIPALSGDRRKQLVAHAKKVGEEAKVTLRNARRDANKHADNLSKQPGTNYPEDEIETLKSEIQDLLKKHEGVADTLVEDKSKEILTV
ncbi:MAG: ribosome recycling factor [Phycisphaerales bacterium]|nr:MAG: ribosome recycling factor [Phycisphaerales bacterium]